MAHGRVPFLFPDAASIMTRADPALEGPLPNYILFAGEGLSSSQQLLRGLTASRPQGMDLPTRFGGASSENGRLAEFWRGLWQPFPSWITPGTAPAPPPALRQEFADRGQAPRTDLPSPAAAAGPVGRPRAGSGAKRGAARGRQAGNIEQSGC